MSKALDSAYVPLQVVLVSGLWSVQSCAQPAKARRATYNKAGGACTSLSDVQFRKASRPMRLTLLARLSRSSCEQWAKVDPKISLTSVRERSTDCNRLQSSHAAGPIQLKSAGRCNDTIPASRKQHSGRQRYKFAGSYSVCSKLRCRKALHFSKARGRNCA